MTVNPEFRRNLWLEFSLQRLVAMPLVLAAVLWIDYLVRSAKGPEYGYLMMRISDDALVIYFALIVLWGSRVAACAVAQEIGDTTWDGQRMSAIGPWAMTWGKLFGSTAFVWYGGVLVLVVIAATSRQEMFVNDDGWIHLEPSLRWITTRIGTVLALGIICHASGLLASLLYIHGGAETRRINVTLFQLVGIAAFFAFFPLYLYGWQPVGDINVPKLHWYGRELVAVDEFIFVSTTIVAAWAVLGVYRMMRAELQMTGWPWLWSLFVLYFAVYLAGFSWFEFEAGVLRPVYASLFVFLCAYAVALCEPKDVAKVRRLIRDVASRQWSSAATTAPLWLVTYGLALGGAVVAVILLMAGDAPGSRVGSTASFLASVCLFLTRDLAILLVLHLGKHPRRADLAAVVYWGVLYVVVPVFLKAAGLNVARPAFLPMPGAELLIAISPILLQAVAALAFLGYRWRAYQGGLAGQPRPS